MECIGCGECCTKTWLLKLTSDYEKQKFKNFIVYGNYIWTNKCPYLKNNKCEIHDDLPFKCKEYYCERY